MGNKCKKILFCLFAAALVMCAAIPAKAASKAVYGIVPKTGKVSSRSIRVTWTSSKDASVKYYYVMRRKTKNNKGTGAWKTRAVVKSDGRAGGSANKYTDKLKSSSPQQYEYKICTLSKKGKVDTRKQKYKKITNQDAVLGTNIKICIDPGHYGTMNNNYDLEGKNGLHPYSEARFNLKIGKALKKELKQTYGIDSYMTRTADKISLKYGGKTFTNRKLDSGSIAIRGYMAKIKNCDFFISLHTNMTSSVKNPWNQPKSVNKVFVFVNQLAYKSSRGVKIANNIGVSLTDYNQSIGLQTAGFQTRGRRKALGFTDKRNDSNGNDGTVIFRRGSSGADYYGVLRGSAKMGVQGVLVEHAFHATDIMRQKAAESSALYKNWAACDAYGIARGFGFAPAR